MGCLQCAWQKRKEWKKLLCYCLVFYCILFPFFSLLEKRLHFLATVVAGICCQEPLELTAWDVALLYRLLYVSLCHPPQPAKGHYELWRKSNSSDEGRKCLWHSIRDKMPFSKAFVGYQAEWIGIGMRNCAINTSNRLNTDDFPCV